MNRQPLLVILTLALAWLAPLSVSATDVRFPEKGVPAFSFVLPDDWTRAPDEAGNLIMFNANRSAGLVIFLGATTEPLDNIAQDAFTTAQASALPRKEPAEISGCEGFTYHGTMTNPAGIKLNVEMTIVRVSAEHIASSTLILATGTAAAEVSTARVVGHGFKLVKK